MLYHFLIPSFLLHFSPEDTFLYSPLSYFFFEACVWSFVAQLIFLVRSPEALFFFSSSSPGKSTCRRKRNHTFLILLWCHSWDLQKITLYRLLFCTWKYQEIKNGKKRRRKNVTSSSLLLPPLCAILLFLWRKYVPLMHFVLQGALSKKNSR